MTPHQSQFMHPYKDYLFEQIFGDRSLTKFAQDANISAGNLSRITRGQNASPEVLQKMAAASSDPDITYQRLVNLLSYVPDGQISIEEFSVYSRRAIIIFESAPSGMVPESLSSTFFAIHRIYQYCVFSDVTIARNELPTYEDAYCLADIFGVPFQYFLKEDCEIPPEQHEKLFGNQFMGDESQDANETLPSFPNAKDALKFILKQPALMAHGGYDRSTMSDQDIADIADDLLYAVSLSVARKTKGNK